MLMPLFQFPFRFSLMEEILPAMVKKTIDQHVLSNLAYITLMFISFDLWVCPCGMDILVLVINFLSDTWVAMHIIVGLFKVNETTRQSMVVQLQYLLE